VPPRLAVVPELDAELDRLYGLQLEEFTAARNELAARLRKAGQAETAERVRALRKPSVAVWAVNQLARRPPDDVQAHLASGERLREAQGAAFRGGDSDTVRAATAAERESVRKLTRSAGQLLVDEGRAASQATLERVAATLRAAAVDPAAAALLAAGRLPDEVEASGFAALAALAPPPGKQRRRTTAKTADRAAARGREQLIHRLRKRIERLERQASDAEERAQRAELAAAEAREHAARTKADLDTAKAELQEAERE
jgi:hypothetical protein